MSMKNYFSFLKMDCFGGQGPLAMTYKGVLKRFFVTSQGGLCSFVKPCQNSLKRGLYA